MKLWLPVVLLSALWSGSAAAQSRVGLRAGLNGATVRGNEVAGSPKAGIGYHIGIFARTSFLDLKLQPEILVSNRRYTFTQEMGDVTAVVLSEKKVSSTYLDVPVFVPIELTEKWHLLVGPQFSLNMSGSQELKNTNKKDDGYAFELFDVSVAAGIEYVFSNGLDLGLRGAYGFLPVFTKTNALVVGPKQPSVQNLTIQFTVGMPITNAAPEEIEERNFNTPY